MTVSYDNIGYEDQPLMTRQLQTLRKHFFACECPACDQEWVMYEEMPDMLHLVPSFEFEKHFVVSIKNYYIPRLNWKQKSKQQ